MRALVTGAASLLAAALIREFGRAGHEVVALGRAALDIADAAAVSRAVRETQPHVVLNCAAYNDVDRAQAEPQAALAVNALPLSALAEAARTAGARLVHYSTDFVFDGETDRPYGEDDRANPRSVYGASKLVGEWLACEHAEAYVLRVESLFGEPGEYGGVRGSLPTMVRRIRAGEPVPVFVDRTVSPAYTTDVAHATRRLVEERQPPGLYHCVNTGVTTWVAIASEIARLLDRPLDVTPITLDSVALAAPRPRYSALSNAKLAAGGISMPAWEDALARYLRRPAGT